MGLELYWVLFLYLLRKGVDVMIVFHLVSSLSYSSGLMSVIMNYYRKISEKCKFVFLYFTEVSDANYKEEIIKLGGECILIPSPKDSLKLFRKKIRLLSKENCDIFHIHEAYLTIFIHNILHKNKVKIIVHAHTTKFSDKFISSIRNKILCLRLSTMVDGCLACSKEAGELYFGKSFFKVLDNAIDLDYYKYDNFSRKKIRDIYNISNDTVVYGNVGRLVPQKNQIFLLDIFKNIVDEQPNSLLMIIGEGPLYENIKCKIFQLKLEKKVLLLGKKDNLNEIYNAMDFFVLPSVFEGLGIVLVEAQANGIPCFASSCIPSNVSILKNFQFVSLDFSSKEWAKIILNSNAKRIDDSKILFTNAGFDISIKAFELLDYYNKILNI